VVLALFAMACPQNLNPKPELQPAAFDVASMQTMGQYRLMHQFQ